MRQKRLLTDGRPDSAFLRAGFVPNRDKRAALQILVREAYSAGCHIFVRARRDMSDRGDL